MAEVKHTPAPWTYSGGEVLDAQGNQICQLYDSFRDPAEDDANGHLMASAPENLAEMKAAAGYLRNAKIDLETGATKATAIRTIEGGLKRLEAAIAKSEGK